MRRRREADSRSIIYCPPSKAAAGEGPYQADPEPSFEEVLRGVGRQFRQHATEHGFDAHPWHTDIVCSRPGTKTRPGKPHDHFFVDAKGGGPGGDGSEATPWLGIDAALDGLNSMRQAGQLELRPGRRIRLSHRETFTATSLEMRRRRRQLIARSVFAVITALLVIPVIMILGYLVIRAWPVLTPSFVLENPADRMTAGGIWAPLVGTFFLAIISLLIDAPIGILAAIYLNEYARDNWLTRLINLAVVNLAGVPSIVHGLFGF